jgi:casein kinase 1
MRRSERRSRQLLSRTYVTDSQVRLEFNLLHSSTNIVSEEFNKYLSYVRNLGFEDTPDYDYLRELFTQALKSTGEVEDGEYDWMKLNNGKGWEAVKSHPSAGHLHHSNINPNSSTAVNLHGNQIRPQKNQLPVGRLEADLPKPGVPRQPPGVSSGRLPRNMDPAKYHPDAVKRKSMAEPGPPEGSTMAQFQNSQPNLVGNRMNQAQSPMTGNAQAHQTGVRAPVNEPKDGFTKKFMRLFCCGA